MNIMLTRFENLLVPVVGICVLLVLGVAVYLEPKKDYSRKLYMTMLSSCMLVLVAEGLQWYFENYVRSALSLWITMFVFYGMLAVLCWCWTNYSYFWFCGHRPRGKTCLYFAVGPFIELIALTVNLFTGFIYSVNADGYYSRGSFFGIYIGFSYLFLLTAIILTAFLTAGKNRNLTKKDFVLFLFCFLFPVAGPLIQYVLPDNALMGITEMAALLIVYISIQQRTTAEYAVEKARYFDEYRAYENSLEQLLAASGDALCFLRFNLTRNTYSVQRGIPQDILDRSRMKSLDELSKAFSFVIRDAKDAEHFRELADRNRLLERFAEGQTNMTLTYRRKVDNGETHLIKVFFNMLKNPGNGDIEGILYSVDVDRQDKEEKIISAIADREYDYIALINSETGRIHYQYAASGTDESIHIVMGDYDRVMGRIASNMRSLSSPGSVFDKISLRTVTEALSRRDEYSCVFEYNAFSGLLRQKKISFRYLDDIKTEILFFASDITEETTQERERSAMLQKALSEARHADAMKSEFLSNVSHDMRTPLNAVLGYTHLAQTVRESEQKQNYLKKIGEAGNLLLSLINDTLDLSKIETGEIILKPSTTQYEQIMGKIITAVTPLADMKRVRFTVDAERAAHVPVKADTLRLQEIVMNLLSNAVKFTPANGQVTLTVECIGMDKKTVHDKITVSDTGCGMNEEFLPKMFEPFAQEMQTTGTVGSGLGLSIVKKLVEMMKGRIEVESEVGKGTRFTVWLDFERAVDSPETRSAAAASAVTLSGRQILLAEDNAMNAEIAQSVLEARQMRVVCAANGKEACRLFSESAPGSFDAILMDIRMPGMDGHTAARTIRRMERPDALTVPIIAMSADAFDDDIQESLNAGMNDHISKPFQPEHLYRVLESAVRTKDLSV